MDEIDAHLIPKNVSKLQVEPRKAIRNHWLTPKEVPKERHFSHRDSIPEEKVFWRRRIPFLGKLIVSQVHASNPQPVWVSLAHHTPSPILWNHLLNLIAERDELLPQPVCKLTPIKSRIGFLVFAWFYVEQ